jgi:hypothetical protein
MNMADMLVHVHPDLDAHARDHLERYVGSKNGVDCVEFDHHPHPHALIVKYDPDVLQGMQILNMVRKIDPAATMVGL